MPWQPGGASWRRPGERVFQAGEHGDHYLASLSAAPHGEGVVRCPGHRCRETQLPRRLVAQLVGQQPQGLASSLRLK